MNPPKTLRQALKAHWAAKLANEPPKPLASLKSDLIQKTKARREIRLI
jgi:hypothetical protein